MAHLAVGSGYQQLTKRLNRAPQGAPSSDTLYKILGVLMSEREAQLVSLLPIRPFRVATAAKAWKLSEAETRKTLDTLAGRAVLLDLAHEGEPLYILPPPMAGFFEFSMMRLRGDVDQKLLAELFYQYLNVEQDFVTALFGRGETQLGRAFVQEEALPPELSLQVLDYERASHVIRKTSSVGVSLCYCRHKKQHLGEACSAPMQICLTFGNTARSLIKHGFARAADTAEGLDLLQQAQDHGLVQFGDNVQHGVSFICNCCGCCCEAMLAVRRLALMHPVHTTNYIASIDTETCRGCGKCVSACPVDALSLRSRHDPRRPKRRRVALDESRCLGCGVCVAACPDSRIRLRPRTERVITPVNAAHKTVLMAIERGRLHDLVFDNQAHLSHRAMAAILGVILALPPVKQALASRQLRSRYLARLLSRR
jgi:ferredoxin